jgi:single-strand DNA-binding protein
MTRDPELRRTGSGIAVTNFTVAVDRDYNPKDGAEKEVDFIDCIAWRGGAEFVSKYFSKGQMAVVSGKLRIRSWTDKDGNKRRSAEVEADSVYFGDSKKSEGTPTTYSQPNPANQEPYTEVMAYVQSLRNAQHSEFEMLEDDDGHLPF